MRIVQNLRSRTELHYLAKDVSPRQAVLSAHILEDATHLRSEYFYALHSDQLDAFLERHSIPLYKTQCRIVCGNWGTLLC